MKIDHFLRVAFAIVLSFSVNVATSAEPANFQDLMIRIASERERILQYAVDLVVEGDAEIVGFDANEKPQRLFLRIEYSRLERHYVVGVRDETVGVDIKNREWKVSGRTRECHIGSVGKLLNIFPLSVDIPNDSSRTLLGGFDPRLTGIASCGDTMSRKSFEAVMSHYLLWKKDLSRSVVKTKKEGVLKFEHEQSDLSLEVDTQRDYWPITYSFHPNTKSPPHTWEVRLEKVSDYWVPAEATFKCGERSAKIAYDWELINEPFEGGLAGIQRIANRYDLKIIDGLGVLNIKK